MTNPERLTSGDYDAIVVGAGYAGLYSLYRLRQQGLSVRLLERGEGVGGTWFFNRYPGCRCDVPSASYSYSFSPELEQEWEWTERYPRQEEVLAYLNHVADRFDLRDNIQLETLVTEATWDDSTSRWSVRTDDGLFTARFCIMATGCLSSQLKPDFKGLDSFEGEWIHTANWPEEPIDVTGKRVAVVGTGSTGVQLIPTLAEKAEHLYVFQRTPNFTVPANNSPLDPEAVRELKANYRELRRKQRESFFGLPLDPNPKATFDATAEEREQEYESRWQYGGGAAFLLSFSDLMTSIEANEQAAEFVRAKIREIVKDPDVAERLTPRDHPLGTKRLVVDHGYYETYNRDNVTLVDIRTAPIEEITPKGIRTPEGEYEVDYIFFAIGFDAFTGALTDISIRGRRDLPLRDKWADGPRMYLGLVAADFPNMFAITGPGSPATLGNTVVAIEQHVDWVGDCLEYMRSHGYERIDPAVEAEDAWVQHVVDVGNATLFPLAKSWYTGANVPGKKRGFIPYIGGYAPYREKCDEIAANAYEGFTFDSADERASAGAEA